MRRCSGLIIVSEAVNRPVGPKLTICHDFRSPRSPISRYCTSLSTVSIQLLPDTSIARPQLLPEPESRHSPVRRPSTTSQGDSDDEDDEVEMVEEEEVVMSEIINDGCHV